MKLLTLNTWCDGPNYFERLEKIIEFLKTQNADIVCLQEVLISGHDKIINALEPLGYNAHKDHQGFYNRVYGELTLVKGTIKCSYRRDYIDPNPNQRSITVVETKGLCILNTHLDLEIEKMHSNQLKQLDEEIKRVSKQKLVVVGDFNFTKGSLNMDEVQTSPTLFDSDYRPDRVYYRGMKLQIHNLIDTYCSDHYCIVCWLE